MNSRERLADHRDTRDGLNASATRRVLGAGAIAGIVWAIDKIFGDFIDGPTSARSTAADWGAIGIGLLTVAAAAFWVRGVGADPGVEEARKIQQAVKRGF